MSVFFQKQKRKYGFNVKSANARSDKFVVGFFLLILFGVLTYFYRGFLVVPLIALIVIVFKNRGKVGRFFSAAFGSRNKLQGEILKSLRVMDDTAHYFSSENEATKELVACMKLRGHDARYQYYLGDGRTCDALIDGAIIEGKLDPQQGDIDRLLGQIQGYLRFNSDIHIVVYGYLSSEARDRILEEIYRRKLKKVFLDFIGSPKRNRG